MTPEESDEIVRHLTAVDAELYAYAVLTTSASRADAMAAALKSLARAVKKLAYVAMMRSLENQNGEQPK